MQSFKHMHKSKIKQEQQRPGGWAEMVSDAEAEISRAERRIKRLRGVVAIARQKLEDGEAFPGGLVSGQAGG